jgi:NAD(P)H-dependent FMN reductase
MTTAERPLKVLAFSGSLKAGSLNQMLVTQAAGMASARGADVTVLSLRDYPLPLFNEDIEHDENPSVDQVRKLFADADALLIASPEYNGSLTPALKNVIDWVSRPASEKGYTPRYAQQSAALIAASPGGLGGLRGLNHVRQILSNIGTLVMPAQLAVPAAHTLFNDQGELTDEETKQRLQNVVDQLLSVRRV